MQPHAVARALLLWVCVIAGVLLFAFRTTTSETPFFMWGPNSHLVLLGVPINTWPRYVSVILYTIASTCARTLHSEVLSPWILTRVQTTDVKSEYAETHALHVVVTSVVFTWLDWFMYLNILLAQLDFLVVEVVGNLGVTLYTTHAYMRGPSPAYSRLP